MDRKKAAVLFGGQSSEHEVSCMSAVNVIRQIDREKYDLLLIGITKDGQWLRVDSLEAIEDGTWRQGAVRAAILPDAGRKCALLQDGERQWEEKLMWCFPFSTEKTGRTAPCRACCRWQAFPMLGPM